MYTVCALYASQINALKLLKDYTACMLCTCMNLINP